MSIYLLLALFSTLGWSGFDAIRKKLVTHLDLIAVGFWINVLPFLGYASVWLAQPIAIDWITYLPPLLASFLLNIVANLLFLYAIKVAPISLMIPVLSFTPVFSGLGSMPLLGEHLSLTQWLGAAGVSFGAVVMGNLKIASASKNKQLMLGFGAMLLVSLFWAVTPIFDKIALVSSSPAAHGTFLSASQALAFALIAWIRANGRQLLPKEKNTWFWIFAAAFCSFLALGLQFIAIKEMPVSVFESVKRALSLVFAIISGACFFHEPITQRKVWGALFMLIGVLLVVGS